MTAKLAQSSADMTLGEYDAIGLGDDKLHLEATVEMLRELSRQVDPQKLVEIFRHRSANLPDGEYLLSLSRRGLNAPWYRITRHADWPLSFNPWERQDELPLLTGGLLGDLIYGDRPRIVHDVSISPDDPGHMYLRGAQSILALPQYDGGVALNMVVRMSRDPYFFDESNLADTVVMSNLFGRATYGLVLAQKLQRANAELEHELKRVGRIQRSLLPRSLPSINGADIAVTYKTATRAGGDYYDLFPLSHGRWGLFIADVSGHGAPAAVVMAILRTILHTTCIDPFGPAEVLRLLNRELSNHSGSDPGTFVTAVYAVFEPSKRLLRYSCAGHPPPILIDQHCRPRELDDAQSLPLAVRRGTDFTEAWAALSPGNTLLMYTDGIIEAVSPPGETFGKQRMLAALCRECGSSEETIDRINGELAHFVGGASRQDDQTLLVLRSI